MPTVTPRPSPFATTKQFNVISVYVFMKKFLLNFIAFHLLVIAIVSIASCGSTRKAFINAQSQMPFDAIIVPG
ncbi:MAG: hypothetical protein ACI9UR_002566, partial [Bacteroidia bacterium]